MMGIWAALKATKIGSKILNKTVKTVGDTINRGQERKHGNVEKNTQRTHDFNMKVSDQYAKEFIKPTNLFDSLVNGVNRIIRPLLALSVVSVFISYNLAPFIMFISGDITAGEFLTILHQFIQEQKALIAAVFTFYFGVRGLEKWAAKKSLVDLSKFMKEKEVDEVKEVKPAIEYKDIIKTKYSKKSQDRLNTCHEDLQKICAYVVGGFDNAVLEGTRTTIQQQEYFKTGRSKLDGLENKSNHQSTPSMAVDLAPYPIDWDNRQR